MGGCGVTVYGGLNQGLEAVCILRYSEDLTTGWVCGTVKRSPGKAAFIHLKSRGPLSWDPVPHLAEHGVPDLVFSLLSAMLGGHPHS